jgi:hypothetical protein
MEIEPAPVHDHLVEIYVGLPVETLEAEETRIRLAAADLVGKLTAIEQVKETNYERAISA